MSRSMGCLKLNDGVYWFSVNNTDVGVSWLYSSRAVLESDMEARSVHPARQCSHEKQAVQFYTSYAQGYYREGSGCPACHTIIYEDETECLPNEDFVISDEFLRVSVGAYQGQAQSVDKAEERREGSLIRI